MAAKTAQATKLYLGNEFPISDLATVDFSCLISQEPDEVDKLLNCCKTPGFFYLDLRGIDGEWMLDDVQKLLQVMQSFFALPEEVKKDIGLPCQAHGYEPIGTHVGINENSKDGYEILKVSRDELTKPSAKIPQALQKDWKMYERFVAGSNLVTKTLLACLSNALNLRGADRFETSHRTNKKSNSTLAMFRYIPKDDTGDCAGHQKHTDIGSLTLLFSQQWGLQVMPPGTSTWEFVAPRPGHAVINVGDSLRFASGNLFQSCIHQVLPMETKEDRYSIAYFLRPESEKKFKDSEGRWITAEQWHDEKYDIFKTPLTDSTSSSILLGGMQQVA